MKRTTNGFTLIELLVVIAIITTLAAILFPAFNSAREKARQVTCASNEKQLGLAFSEYVTDYDEHFPPSDSYGQGYGGTIYPYVKSVNVFVCPDDQTQTANGKRVSYAANVNLVGYGDSYVSGQDIHSALSSLTSPTNTVLLCEIAFNKDPWNNGPDVTNPSEVYTGSASGSNAGSGGTRPSTTWNDALYSTGGIGGYSLSNYNNLQTGLHGGGSNYLAVDGHVKWLLPQKVSGGLSAATPTSTEVHNSNWNQGFAAGASSLTQQSGTQVVLTFSPI